MMSEIIVWRQLIERESASGGTVVLEGDEVVVSLYHSMERVRTSTYRLPAASLQTPWTSKTLLGEIFATFYRERLDEVRLRISGPMPPVFDVERELEGLRPERRFDTFSDLPEIEILEEVSGHTVEAEIPADAIASWLELTEPTKSADEENRSTVAFDSSELQARLRESQTVGFVTTPGASASVGDQVSYLKGLFSEHGGQVELGPDGGFRLVLEHPRFGGEYHYALTPDEVQATPAAALVARVLSQTDRIPRIKGGDV